MGLRPSSSMVQSLVLIPLLRKFSLRLRAAWCEWYLLAMNFESRQEPALFRKNRERGTEHPLSFSS
jgi:hypothetical protein